MCASIDRQKNGRSSHDRAALVRWKTGTQEHCHSSPGASASASYSVASSCHSFWDNDTATTDAVHSGFSETSMNCFRTGAPSLAGEITSFYLRKHPPPVSGGGQESSKPFTPADFCTESYELTSRPVKIRSCISVLGAPWIQSSYFLLRN